jgi:exopolysaccharide biosynthesis protein
MTKRASSWKKVFLTHGRSYRQNLLLLRTLRQGGCLPFMRKRVLKVSNWLLFIFFYSYISSSFLLFHGPFTNLRSYVVDSLAITRHAYLLRPLSLFTIYDAEIRKHSEGWTLSPNVPATTIDNGFHSKTYSSNIQIQDYSTNLWSAKIMFVSNPKKVKVAVTKYIGSVGESVRQMVKDTGAIAGVNGGAFDDAKWQGTGGIPVGTVISNGKILQVDPKTSTIGITKDGQLVCGMYPADVLRSGEIVDAVSFGPILVRNGIGVAPHDAGRAARVAIGQRKDGTIIFVVTDGRGVHGLDNLGATYQDVQDLMLKYGAITAANLDGGSSATFVYKGKLINTPSDILGERKVATAFVVLP